MEFSLLALCCDSAVRSCSTEACTRPWRRGDAVRLSSCHSFGGLSMPCIFGVHECTLLHHYERSIYVDGGWRYEDVPKAWGVCHTEVRWLCIFLAMVRDATARCQSWLVLVINLLAIICRIPRIACPWSKFRHPSGLTPATCAARRSVTVAIVVSYMRVSPFRENTRIRAMMQGRQRSAL